MDRKGGKSRFLRTFILNEMEVIKMSFEYLDSPKLKKFQRKVTLLSAGGTFLDGYDLTIIAVAMPLILNQWEITPIMQGLLTSSADYFIVFRFDPLSHYIGFKSRTNAAVFSNII